MIVYYEDAKEMLEDFRLRSLVYLNNRKYWYILNHGYLFFRMAEGKIQFYTVDAGGGYWRVAPDRTLELLNSSHFSWLRKVLLYNLDLWE